MPNTELRMDQAPRLPAVIPVLDLLEGEVVRAIAGARQAYRPLQLRWPAVPDPSTWRAGCVSLSGIPGCMSRI